MSNVFQNLQLQRIADSLSGGGGAMELALGVEIPEMVGATATDDGQNGVVKAPRAGDENKFWRGDGTWQEAGGGGGVTYENRASVDTGDVWIDGNPIKVFTLYYNGSSGSSNRIQLSDFGFTDTINNVVDIKTVYRNSSNGETHSQGAYCYSWYIGGWINTYINLSGTIYIRFYYT
jgi:hypothetical protein